MRPSKHTASSTLSPLLSKRLRESGSILLWAIALLLLMALLSFHAADPGWSQVTQTTDIKNITGRTGALCADILLSLVGYIAYLFPLALGYLAFRWYRAAQETPRVMTEYLGWLRTLGFLMALLGGTGMMALHYKTAQLPMSAGGALGAMVHAWMFPRMQYWGESVVLTAFVLSGLTLFTGISWLQVMEFLGRWALKAFQHTRVGLIDLAEDCQERWPLIRKMTLIEETESMGAEDFAQRDPLEEPLKKPQPRKSVLDSTGVGRPLSAVPIKTPLKVPIVKPPVQEPVPVFKPTLADHSEAPSLSLLETTEGLLVHGFSEAELQVLSELVERRLAEFGVEVKVVAVSPGPVITRFELDLAAGVKVSKIVGLAKDLARALSVVSLRVVEIIPGKSTVGLEIPNQEREMVRLKEILQDPAYQQARSPLTLGLGKDISGQVIVADLAKMPHLLVAGTTGAGKSVGLNAMLLSILYKATPQDVRLILIDPKMLELAVYDNIPHLLTPVVTDMKEAANALRWCVAEMERRYQLMAALGVRHLTGYNAKIEEALKQGQPLTDPLWTPQSGMQAPVLSTLPYIVVLIDEFADMMMVVGKKVEELIARIAQKARAAGIHLILATQRPSVDVITGLIKANIPSRVAFQVSSRIDSRTILDQSGAEQLLGHGDMLYLPPGVGIPIRIHGAFVADEEVHKVVTELRSRGAPEYVEAILKTSSIASLAGEEEMEGGESDELYDQAVAIVLESRRASISYIQRRLKIGYNRAARLLEQMEVSGVVSTLQSNGVREVLVSAATE